MDNPVSFGIAASYFAAKVSVRWSIIDLAQEFPSASRAPQEPFYIDEGLTGADISKGPSFSDNNFSKYILRNAFPSVSGKNPCITLILPETRDSEEILSFTDSGTGITKMFGILSNTKIDIFIFTVSMPKLSGSMSKWTMLSYIPRCLMLWMICTDHYPDENAFLAILGIMHWLGRLDM